MDADTRITKTAITAAKDSPVHALADDTDILSLLIYHMTNSSTDMYNIYITCKKGTRKKMSQCQRYIKYIRESCN